MKYLENNTIDKSQGLPTAGIRLSRYITVIIVLLVIFSVSAVSGILYFNLSKSLTREFEEKIRAEGGEAGQIFQNRFERLKNSLNSLAHDNTVRVTLMLGAHHQLNEYLRNVYGNNPDLHFIIKDGKTGSFFTHSQTWANAEQINKAFPFKTHQVRLDHSVEEIGFQLIKCVPIMRQSEQIGIAAVAYQINTDSYLRSLLEHKGAGDNRLIYLDGGRGWDIISGEELVPADGFKEIETGANALKYVNIQGEDFFITRLRALEGLHYVANQRSLRDTKKRVLFSVLLPAVVVSILTLLTAFFLSRRILMPLQQLAEFAHKIIEGTVDRAKGIPRSRIFEFNQLNDSLLTMFSHLNQARDMERYQDLFEGVGDMVFIHNLEGKVVDANKVAMERLGCVTTDFLQKDLFDFAQRERGDSEDTGLAKLNRESDQLVFVTAIADREGRSLYVECHARKIILKDQEVILNIARDISARARAENALKESHKTLLTVLDSIQATIYVSDVETREILFMNRYMSEIFGKNKVGEKCYKVVKGSEKPCRQCKKAVLISAEEQLIKVLTWEAKNPVTGNWYVHYDRLIRWVDGRMVKIQIAFDITERKELELKRDETQAQLRKAQKMESIATLAGGVAHDLNNILSGIVSYPDLLLMQLPEKTNLRAPLQTIKDTGMKASAIVQDLLTLARRGVVADEVINLNDVIRQYLESPEYQQLSSNNSHVEIQVELQTNLLNILGSSVHLSKTVMNLVTNAFEAIHERGSVTITTATTILNEGEAAAGRIGPGEYVTVTIHDTGAGIAKEDQERIFEPFFTTKVMGRSGTGLGMAVVWGTVVDHEGYIDLQSELGKGTTFVLYLPVTRKKLLQDQRRRSRENYQGNGESILVVDDIAEQREIASLMFTQMGYNVFAVSSGEKAIEFLRGHSVDLVLLDMIMDGGINGLETYRRILEISPEQKAIITTGYSETDLVREAIDLGVGQYVKKPYLLDEIAKAVKHELAGKPREEPLKRDYVVQ